MQKFAHTYVNVLLETFLEFQKRIKEEDNSALLEADAPLEHPT